MWFITQTSSRQEFQLDQTFNLLKVHIVWLSSCKIRARHCPENSRVLNLNIPVIKHANFHWIPPFRKINVCKTTNRLPFITGTLFLEVKESWTPKYFYLFLHVSFLSFSHLSISVSLCIPCLLPTSSSTLTPSCQNKHIESWPSFPSDTLCPQTHLGPSVLQCVCVSRVPSKCVSLKVFITHIEK